MVLVEPQVVDCHEDELDALPPHQVQEGSDVGEDGQTLILNHTFSFLVHPVEVGTLHTIPLRLETRLAFLVAVLFTDAVPFDENVFNTVTNLLAFTLI